MAEEAGALARTNLRNRYRPWFRPVIDKARAGRSATDFVWLRRVVHNPLEAEIANDVVAGNRRIPRATGAGTRAPGPETIRIRNQEAFRCASDEFWHCAT